jgi:electron transfer flavoprotein beta subunit
LKICVLVKEVPDAAVDKRIDPETKRLDRSGEKNLNPFDTHAIEAAMQVKEGGTNVEEIVAVTMGPTSFCSASSPMTASATRSARWWPTT